jgi:flagellar protein FliO/FliZ
MAAAIPRFPVTFVARVWVALATALPVASRAQGAPAQDLGGSAFQLLFGLLAVLALLFVSLWLLKRLSAPRGEASRLMRVVAGTAVGTRERVVVLEIGTTWLVLGVAPGHVTALAELPRADLPGDTATPQADFAGRLRHLLNPNGKP